MSECDRQLLAVPGLTEPLRLSLPADIRRLRKECLASHSQPWGQLPELDIADAKAWADRPDDEPWLIWRARRFAARLTIRPDHSRRRAGRALADLVVRGRITKKVDGNRRPEAIRETPVDDTAVIEKTTIDPGRRKFARIAVTQVGRDLWDGLTF